MIGHLVDVELARQQWEDGRRAGRAVAPRTPGVAPLSRDVEIVSPSCAAHRADLHARASSPPPTTAPTTGCATLLYDARAEDAPPPDTATVTDAAFQLYARGALDYRP